MDCHNVIAQDGPCDCAGCRNIGQMEVQARCDRDEIRRLREENARLRELSVWGTSEPVGPKYDEILRLRQRVEELERALSFYADTRRYQGSNQPYRDGDDPFTSGKITLPD